MPTRVVLFSGLGADGRLFHKLRLAGLDVEAPRYLDPRGDEDLPAYAARLGDEFSLGPKDVVGGCSFGGMVASEIAARRPVGGLILLATCHDPSGLRPWYGGLERVSRLAPDSLVRPILEYGTLFAGKLVEANRPAARLVFEMLRDSSRALLRQGSRMIVSWRGVPRPSCPGIWIHGDRDHVIPLRRVKPDVVIPGAPHVFPLTHAEETSRILRAFMAGDCLPAPFIE